MQYPNPATNKPKNTTGYLKKNTHTTATAAKINAPRPERVRLFPPIHNAHLRSTCACVKCIVVKLVIKRALEQSLGKNQVSKSARPGAPVVQRLAGCVRPGIPREFQGYYVVLPCGEIETGSGHDQVSERIDD